MGQREERSMVGWGMGALAAMVRVIEMLIQKIRMGRHRHREPLGISTPPMTWTFPVSSAGSSGPSPPLQLPPPSSLTLRPSVMLLGGPCRGRYPALFRIASPSKAHLRPQLTCPAQLCLPSACLLFQSSPWSLIQRPLEALPCSGLQSLPCPILK